MKTGLKIAGIVLGVLLATQIIMGVVWGFDRLWTYYFGAEIQGKVEAEKQIESAPNRISEYEYFHDLCRSVRSKERKIQNALSRLEKTESQDTRERIMQNINGLRNMRAETISKYNSQSSKDYTAARFKDSNLPPELKNTRFEENDELTECELK